MKGIQFNLTIPRYVLGRTLGRLYPPVLWNGLSCTAMDDDLQVPDLLGPDWVRVKTRYGGICGSDLNVINLNISPYYSPFSSYPYTFGHENVGYLAKVGTAVQGWEIGDRVVVEPTLWCRPRGFSDLCTFCARGEINRCERLTQGPIAPGASVGFCRDTGGSWSEFFLAHESQLFRVPTGLSDENTLMIEPFACGLHAVLQNMPANSDTVAILGAGTIGLVTLAALRALGSRARVLVIARYPFQVDAARRLGASEVISGGRGGDYLTEIAERTGGQILQPIIGKRAVVGGVDKTFECVGNDSSLDDSLRMTRAGGRITLVGLSGMAKGVDWANICHNELEVKGGYIFHHAEQFQGKTWKTFDLALDLLARGVVDLGWMVTHRFKISEYQHAVKAHQSRGQHDLIKAVFDFGGTPAENRLIASRAE
jgi:threonine dehydrogenase-like Zn-dependent dehydrogenase